ncbi:MAG: ABC transporter ATP-binding protein [Actinomycetaceae bacterium]|nr:ABC transporter ATP-binding protein [Actinomycetaceae bacterium]
MSNTILRATGIRKTFAAPGARGPKDASVEVLKGIDLEVSRGEFLAIMGASGSGKSTVLYSISGMDRPTEGRVEFEGRELTSLKDSEVGRLRLTSMGFVFQQPFFLENLSVYDNVLLPAAKSGLFEGGEAEARVSGLLERFGIAHVGLNEVSRVSGGQLQRAAICRAIVNGPSVVFADEPTGALNSRMTTEVLDVLGEIHAEGTTIVMVTHDPSVAARADRIVYLRDGVVVDELSSHAEEASGSTRKERVLSWLQENGF